METIPMAATAQITVNVCWEHAQTICVWVHATLPLRTPITLMDALAHLVLNANLRTATLKTNASPLAQYNSPIHYIRMVVSAL
jgi:hypothetical protein